MGEGNDKKKEKRMNERGTIQNDMDYSFVIFLKFGRRGQCLLLDKKEEVVFMKKK